MSGSVNPWHGEPPTGEPDAGEPHVRFGGRGDRVINRSSLPLSPARRVENGARLAIWVTALGGSSMVGAIVSSL